MLGTLGELYDAMRVKANGGYPPDLVGLPDAYLNRMTKSFVKDEVQFRRISAALGEVDMWKLPLCRFNAAAVHKVEAHLLTEELGAVTNTVIKARLIRDLAVHLGHAEAALVVPAKPKRMRLTRVDSDGKRVKTREKRGRFVPRYQAPIEEMSDAFQQEVKALERFCTGTVVRGRNGKAHRGSTWDGNRDRIERFFGALEKKGYPLASAKLADMADLEKIDAYTQFFLALSGGVQTYTLKDMYVLCQLVAARFLKNMDAAADITDLLKQTKFERVKDHDLMVQLVDADDLYSMADQAYDHALAYKSQWFHRKPCRAVLFPKAMVAYHVGRALAVYLALATWLRRDNLFSIVYTKNLNYRGKELWFSFTKEEMKGDEPHTGQVRDLWCGEKPLHRIKELLALYLELRPHLVERFVTSNPSMEAPKELLLTKRGSPYGGSAQYYLFTSLSAAYLGPDKVVNPHAVRHIIPSYLIRDHGYEIMGEIQSLLAHRSIITTNSFYARASRLFSAEKAQERINTSNEQAETVNRLKRVEMKLDSLLEAGEITASAEIKLLVEEIRSLLPPAA